MATNSEPTYYEEGSTDVERRILGEYNSSLVKEGIMSYHQNITRLSTEVNTEALKYIFLKFGTTFKNQCKSGHLPSNCLIIYKILSIKVYNHLKGN